MAKQKNEKKGEKKQKDVARQKHADNHISSSAIFEKDLTTQGISSINFIEGKIGEQRLVLTKKYIIDDPTEIAEALAKIAAGTSLNLSQYKNF